MILRFEQFERAAKEVEKIISLPDDADLTSEIKKAGDNIPKDAKREFYRHMNSLFLNILLNRLDELGKGAELRSIKARKIIVSIINEL